MTWTHLTVVAEMLAKQGKEEELRRTLLALVEPTRKEDGCIQYDVHQSTEEPRRFFFYENWTSLGHLDRHLQSAHLTAFQKAAPELLAEPVRIVTCTRIA
ncbi:MAG TPA: putative quinol monooxygenase [Bryobacteraceae bacterium]|nr:putative quinol monooxygenase [Bryobacteraceae bacterium]